MKKNQYIRDLIDQFTENNFSKGIILKFQSWFIDNDNRDEKDKIIEKLWDKEPSTISRHTLKALEEIKQRIEQPKKRILQRSMLQYFYRIAVILLLPIISVLATYWVMQNNEKPLVASQITEYITSNGEIKEIVLPDSSRVWLNSASVLLFSEDSYTTHRHLFLVGEATFQVTKNPDNPFIVKTQRLQVQALGTTFNIKSYEDIYQTEVTLTEGLVRVDIGTDNIKSELIYPNEQLVYNHRYNETIKRTVNAELVGKWKEGYLVFENASFEEVIHALERRFDSKINYDVKKYGGGNYSIKYTPFENIQQALRILKALNPGMSWETTDNNTINIK